MSSFEQQLQAFARKLDARTQAVFVESGIVVHESIQAGSDVTGSPGQPIDTGYLWGSWLIEHESETQQLISTPVAYAPVIEDGERESYDPEGLERPPEWDALSGGTNRVQGNANARTGPFYRHSVRLTRHAWQNVVDHVRRKVVPHD